MGAVLHMHGSSASRAMQADPRQQSGDTTASGKPTEPLILELIRSVLDCWSSKPMDHGVVFMPLAAMAPQQTLTMCYHCDVVAQTVGLTIRLLAMSAIVVRQQRKTAGGGGQGMCKPKPRPEPRPIPEPGPWEDGRDRKRR